MGGGESPAQAAMASAAEATPSLRMTRERRTVCRSPESIYSAERLRATNRYSAHGVWRGNGSESTVRRQRGHFKWSHDRES